LGDRNTDIRIQHIPYHSTRSLLRNVLLSLISAQISSALFSMSDHAPNEASISVSSFSRFATDISLSGKMYYLCGK
ncbi:MAG: hypothetical protein LBV39_02130, partial [Bacteroidales bacterium]|nr:hypothetical protein [Bacteroidales bacterium]